MLVTMLVALVLLQVPVDTATTTDPHVVFVLSLAGLAAFLSQWISGWLVNKWNKIGGWLDGKQDGLKRIVGLVLTAAGGLLLNALAGLVTDSNSWIVTFLLALLAGVIQMFNTGTAITIAKQKTVARGVQPGRLG